MLILWIDLVRRVVEARRLHYHTEATLARPPPSRAGQSVHTTALPPTTADASVGGVGKSRFRHSRFLGFGRGRKFDGLGSDAKESNDGEKGEKGEKSRRRFFRRLCCWC